MAADEVKERYAYVALTDSGYVDVTSVMLKSLVESGPSHPIRVMCLEDVTAEQKRAMEAIGPTVESWDIERIALPERVAVPYEAWRVSFSRLRMLSFEEFDKLLFLESDMIINENIDELFSQPPLSACSHHYPIRDDRPSLNSGLLLLAPDAGLFRRIMEEYIHLPSPWPPHTWTKPDQEMFIALFSLEPSAVRWRERHGIEMEHHWHPLDYRYNAIVGLKGEQIDHWDAERAKVLHYTCGAKPWRSGCRETPAERAWWRFHDLLTGDREDANDEVAPPAPREVVDCHWDALQRFVESGRAESSLLAASAAGRSGATARLSRYDRPASGALGDRWIVTSADRHFRDFIVAFVASLRDVARYRGRIGIIDYGLTQGQCDALKGQGVEIIRPRRGNELVIDRYLTIAERFADDPDATICYFDADIWFTEPFDELFDDRQLHCGQLAAAKDVWECDYYYSCAPESVHPAVRAMLDQVKARFGQSLQAGFIGGSSGAWLRLTDLLVALLEKGFAADRWGTDALALNFYATLYGHRFRLLPITYNAPPAWGVVAEGERFYATKFTYDGLHEASDGAVVVKAIHRTTPFRGPRHYEELAFEQVHPELFRRWSRLLDGG